MSSRSDTMADRAPPMSSRPGVGLRLGSEIKRCRRLNWTLDDGLLGCRRNPRRAAEPGPNHSEDYYRHESTARIYMARNRRYQCSKPTSGRSLVLLLLNIGLFIPMGWGAPQGPVLLVRNSVSIVPSVAGEVIDVPVERTSR